MFHLRCPLPDITNLSPLSRERVSLPLLFSVLRVSFTSADFRFVICGPSIVNKDLASLAAEWVQSNRRIFSQNNFHLSIYLNNDQRKVVSRSVDKVRNIYRFIIENETL